MFISTICTSTIRPLETKATTHQVKTFVHQVLEQQLIAIFLLLSKHTGIQLKTLLKILCYQLETLS